jgi:hypothetical protein
VVLFLDSAGGKVDDGDRVIEVLNEIKLRRQLITVVPHGNPSLALVCGLPCARMRAQRQRRPPLCSIFAVMPFALRKSA